MLAGFIGNVVEWCDFALYGYMAGILSRLFFPGESPAAGLIATYGVFAAGFLMRPLGSGVFGWLGDTIGRSRTMLISVSMMALPTFLLGCLPTFETAGIWAPVLLVLVRLVQGLSHTCDRPFHRAGGLDHGGRPGRFSGDVVGAGRKP